MEQRVVASYLESQILTASPQKLRLMLIEGGLSAARQTLEHWEHGRNERALESLIRCRKIIAELLSGVRPDDSELARRVAGIYVFLFQALTEAQLRRDRQRVLDTIRVLQIEHETWRQVCESAPHAASLGGAREQREITASAAQRLLIAAQPDRQPPATGGLLLDA